MEGLTDEAAEEYLKNMDKLGLERWSEKLKQSKEKVEEEEFEDEKDDDDENFDEDNQEAGRNEGDASATNVADAFVFAGGEIENCIEDH